MLRIVECGQRTAPGQAARFAAMSLDSLKKDELLKLAKQLQKENVELKKANASLETRLQQVEGKVDAAVTEKVDPLQQKLTALSHTFSCFLELLAGTGLLGDNTSVLRDIAASSATPSNGDPSSSPPAFDLSKLRQLAKRQAAHAPSKKRFVVYGPATEHQNDVHKQIAGVLGTSELSITVDKIVSRNAAADDAAPKRATFVVNADAHHVDKALNTGIVRAQLKEKGSKLYIDWFCTPDMRQERAKLEATRAELIKQKVWVKWDGVKLMQHITKDDGSKVWEQVNATNVASTSGS